MPRTPSPQNLRVPRTRLPPGTTASQSPPPFLSTPPGAGRQGCPPGGGGSRPPCISNECCRSPSTLFREVSAGGLLFVLTPLLLTEAGRAPPPVDDLWPPTVRHPPSFIV